MSTQRTLVVYYTYEFNFTKTVGETIARKLGAETLELKVVPGQEMTSKGFGKFLWGGLHVFQQKRPDLEPFEKDTGSYDNFVICTPCWAWTFTPAIGTFIDKTPGLEGKKAILIVTNGGGPKQTENKMSEAVTKRGMTVLGTKAPKVPDKTINSPKFAPVAEELAEWAAGLL